MLPQPLLTIYNFPPEISKNLSKKLVNLLITLSRFLVRAPLGSKRDTAGKTLVIAVPVVATLPSRKEFFTNVTQITKINHVLFKLKCYIANDDNYI